MANRVIHEEILTSERVNSLDFPAEIFYRRLMSRVDEHGLHDGRPSILKASLYPLKRVRHADISLWIAACEKAGLIALYDEDGKPYLQMLDWRSPHKTVDLSDAETKEDPAGFLVGFENEDFSEPKGNQTETGTPPIGFSVGSENVAGADSRHTLYAHRRLSDGR